jgi:hypothetical protein
MGVPYRKITVTLEPYMKLFMCATGLHSLEASFLSTINEDEIWKTGHAVLRKYILHWSIPFIVVDFVATSNLEDATEND